MLLSRVVAAVAIIGTPLAVLATVNASDVWAATTCTQNTTGATISNATTFEFLTADRTIESGTLNAEGAVYRYSQADPDNLYDVLVTAVDVDNSQGPTEMIDPVQDTDGAGVEALMTPRWTADDGTRTGAAWNTFQTFRIQFVLTGTSTPATVTVLATTVDNDGAVNGDPANPTYIVKDWD